MPIPSPTQEIKPCPFCGGNNIEVIPHYDQVAHTVVEWFEVACNTNDCSLFGFYVRESETPEQAIAKWNERNVADANP